MDFHDKTAFVTGAGSGIGRTTAIAFACAGANVVLVDVAEQGLAETSRLIGEDGGEAHVVVTDVRCPDQTRSAVDACIKRYGRLDCAFNNAGTSSQDVDFATQSLDEIRNIFEVNVMGVLHCMQAQIEVMLRSGGGTIVNTASAAGLVGLPKFSVYSATKHAVVGLTKSVAMEYAAQGIRVNSVCPGFVPTPLSNLLTPTQEALHATIALFPIGRIGKTSEIADAVLWLSSPQSSFVVGTNIPIDGGFSA